MIEAGKKAGKRLQIGYRMHWDAATLACIAALREGEIGPIQIIQTATGFTIGDPKQWRLNKKLAGGGCLMDIGIYSLSAARYLIQTPRTTQRKTAVHIAPFRQRAFREERDG